jgi:LytS/YehU family sensor histidine kinase
MNPAGYSMNPAFTDLYPVDHSAFCPQHIPVFDAARQRLFHPPRFWLINSLVWFGIGVIAFLARLVMHQDIVRALLLALSGCGVGFILSAILRQFYRAKGFQVSLHSFFAIQILTLTVFASTLHAGALQIAINLAHWQALPYTPWERMFLLTIALWTLYLAWSLGYFLVKAELHSHRESLRAAEASANARKTELQLLRFQLDPHFLFNTLNGISSEILSHPNAAIDMVGELSSYLRYSLDHRSQLITRLAVELDATKAYLRIQTCRFGERLSTRIETSPKAREILVPSFLLQPMVENAFKHGFELAAPPWHLNILAEVQGEQLLIQIRNTGHLCLPTNTEGVGLETIRRRLEIHYPNRHSVDLDSADGQVSVTLRLEGPPCFA